MPGASPLRLLAVVAAVVAATGSLAAGDGAPGHRDDDGVPAHLHLGEVKGGELGTIDDATPMAFWQTPYLACDTPPDVTSPSAPPGCRDGEELRWTVVVGDTDADLLRVDLDQPYRQDAFDLHVVSPDGAIATSPGGGTNYSHGVAVEFPEAGEWTVRLTPDRTAGTIVRLRAGLVARFDPTGDGGERPLLPNLRATPPFEFGLVAPVNPLNSMFLASDDQNPGVEAAGLRPLSCTPDEVQEASDPSRTSEPAVLVRCLRFTSGPHNVGDGHLDLRFPFRSRALAGGDRVEEMTQVVHHADGSMVERPAGTWEYHATHGHYHYVDILHYRLLAVRDAPAGVLEQVGRGRKSGLCPDDQGYGDWSSFGQSPDGAVARAQSGSCLPAFGTGDHAMGLSAGWGDYYRWQRPGQYVDFSGQPDGLYVVQVTIDPTDNVLEQDESDNTSYALVRVTGDEVELLERGHGESPWDPTARPIDDGRA